jgi:uncharacterized cupredoxin-like copper-binding protein
MSRNKRKRGRGRAPSSPLDSIRPLAGWIAAGAVAVAIAVVAVVLLAGGSGDGETTAPPVATRDPRVGQATPAATLSVNADDEGQQVNPRFEPAELTGPAGEAFEIVINNVGTVAHNLRVSGADRTYDTRDDFASAGVAPGDEATLPVKIDQAGAYPFRCDFHPQQTGTLVLR